MILFVRRAFEVTGLVGVIVGACTWLLGVGSTIGTLKTLPDDVKQLSIEVRELAVSVAKIEGKLYDK